MSYIAHRLENVTDPKKHTYPGDYILEVRVVYATGAEGKVFFSTIKLTCTFVPPYVGPLACLLNENFSMTFAICHLFRLIIFNQIQLSRQYQANSLAKIS